MASIYDAIIAGSHANTDPSYVPPSGAEVVFPGTPAGVSRVTGEGLNVYSRPTYSVDGYGNPILQQQQQDAVARALSVSGGGRGSLGARGDVAAALSGIPSANGSLVAGKSQDRLTPNAFGYGENGMTGANPEVAALNAIKSATGPGRFAFTGSDPFSAYTKNYTATARPASLRAPTVFSPQTAGTGVFGQRMSPGMASVLNTDPRYAAQRTGVMPAARQPVAITVRGGNKTQQALAQVAASSPPSAQQAPAVNYAYSQSSTGDGQGNNGISEGGGRWGGATSLTSR